MSKKLIFELIVKTEGLQKSMEDVKDSVDDIADGMEGISDEIKDLGDSSKKTNETLSGMKSGFDAIGVSMKAMGIAILLQALNYLWDIMQKNQVVMDILSVVTTTLEITFKKITQTIVSVVKGFQDFGGTITRLKDKIKNFSFKKFKEGVKKTVSDVKEFAKETVNTAVNIKNLTNEVSIAESEQRKLQMTYQRDAELQRQIRDDVSKTIDERIQANERLGEILDEQFIKEKAQADRKLRLAQEKLATDESNIEFQKAVIDAETELMDLEERITGQRSEMLTNTNGLLQEQRDLQNELSTVGMSERDRELQELDNYYTDLLDKARIAGTETANIEQAKRDAMKELKAGWKDEDDEEKSVVYQELMTERELELYEADQHYTNLLETADKFGLDKAELTKNYNEKVRQINKQYDDKEVDTEKGKQEELWKLKVQSAQKVLVALGQIAGEGTRLGKATAVASIAIDSGMAIASAISGASKAANAGGPAAPFLIAGYIATMVGAVASGISNAKQALSGVEGPDMPDLSLDTPDFSPPSVSNTGQNESQQDAISGNFEDFQLIPQAEDVQPIQAYVVESDISDTQALQSELEFQATL